MSQAKIIANLLSEAQFQFIESELGFNSETIRGMSDEAIDKMYDEICEIEIAETVASENKGGTYSDRERMAEGIVTIIGNALYRPEHDE